MMTKTASIQTLYMPSCALYRLSYDLLNCVSYRRSQGEVKQLSYRKLNCIPIIGMIWEQWEKPLLLLLLEIEFVLNRQKCDNKWIMWNNLCKQLKFSTNIDPCISQ